MFTTKKVYGSTTGQAVNRGKQKRAIVIGVPGRLVIQVKKQSAECVCFDGVKVYELDGRYKPSCKAFYDGKEWESLHNHLVL